MMQAPITISVTDRPLPASYLSGMLTADEIREELIRQLDAKKVRGVDVARLLSIDPPRVNEMKKRTREVQQREMNPLAEYLGMIGPANAEIISMLQLLEPEELELVHGMVSRFAKDRVEGGGGNGG